MSTEKTLEKEISDLRFPDCGMLSHNDLRVLLEFIRSRESKRSGWVKAWERLPAFDELVFMKVLGKKTAGVFFTWDSAKDGESQLSAPDMPPIVSNNYERLEVYWWYESPSSVPEPDAEKDQRLAELEKENKNLTGSLEHMIDQADEHREKIRQLESQLKEANIRADDFFTKILSLTDDKNKIESQLQAPKEIDVESLFAQFGEWDKPMYPGIMDETHREFIMRMPGFIKAIQSLHP